MFSFLLTGLLLFAGGGGTGASPEWWDKYINFPGFEIWRFVNLAIFVGILIYILKKPLSEAFKARREIIRAELIKAEEAKKAALAKLTEVETKLAGADAEIDQINREAKNDIEVEKARLMAQAEAEAKKLKQQAENESVRVHQVAQLELRRFAAEESLRVAEEKLRERVTPETDNRLVKEGIAAIGGLN